MAKFVGIVDIAILTTIIKMITIKLTIKIFDELFYYVHHTCIFIDS